MHKLNITLLLGFHRSAAPMTRHNLLIEGKSIYHPADRVHIAIAEHYPCCLLGYFSWRQVTLNVSSVCACDGKFHLKGTDQVNPITIAILGRCVMGATLLTFKFTFTCKVTVFSCQMTNHSAPRPL